MSAFGALPQTQGLVSLQFMESMMSRMLVVVQLFEESRTVIVPELFNRDGEQYLAVLLRSMQDVYAQYGSFEYETLHAHITTLLCDTPLPPDQHTQLLDEPDGLLYWTLRCGATAISATPLEQSREMVRRFLQERAVFGQLHTALQMGVPQDMRAVLQSATQTWERISQIDTDPISSGLPDGRRSAPRIIVSTGLPYMDQFMDGGQAAGEAYGLLGPTGVGKTSLACMMAGACLMQRRAEVSLRNPEAYGDKFVYYVTYEAPRDEIRQRITSHVCEISRESVKHMDFGGTMDQPTLTTARLGNYHPYEHNVPNNQELPYLPGELERFQRQAPMLGGYLRVVDLSGLGDARYTRMGTGGCDEVVSLIAQDQKRNGNPGVAMVVIDYVLLAVERYLNDRGLDLSRNLRLAIPAFVDGLRTQVGGRFNTPVWLLHQFNTEGNKKSPTTPLTHNDAAEAGNRFAQNLAYVATLGTKDPESSCTLLNFSKTRSAGASEPRILQINGLFHRMLDVTESYAISRVHGRLMPRKELQAIGYAPGQQAPAAARNPGYRPTSDSLAII